MSLEDGLVRCWYGRSGPCRWLIPLSFLFAFVAWLRRRFYRLGWLRVTRLPVPVIVVGNITVGGTGKTPLVIWLAQRLRAHGHRPGIVSRGYTAAAREARPVGTADDPALVGDEPLLIAQRSGCPVWIGRRRAGVAKALLEAQPGVDVIISDDGLQHYALGRDIEIAVVDGRRGLGNGRRLPAGPLREGPARLREVDAVVVNGSGWKPSDSPTFDMYLEAADFHAVGVTQAPVAASHFAGRQVHALAGIGHPERFFETLSALGVDFTPHVFPDHYRYRATDLPAGTIVMTEKDAVKCAAFGREDVWALAVDARVPERLERQLLDKLETCHGQQAA